LFEIAKFLAAIALPIVHSINILISSLVLPLAKMRGNEWLRE